VFECHAQAGPQGSFEKPRFKGVGAQRPYPQQTIAEISQAATVAAQALS